MNKITLNQLQLSRKNLTAKYQTNSPAIDLTSEERLVYLNSRMPATQAVCQKILANFIDNKASITSLLDLGCGPGGATYAALSLLPNLTTMHLLDKDPNYTYILAKPYQFFLQDFNQLNLSQVYDLIMISYALNECSDELLISVLTKAWQATEQYLVIIEPGTSHGYAKFLIARQFLITQGAFLIAPCPHQSTCPLIKPDWCHFKLRLPRSKLHQQIKQGSKSFEDESYIFGIFAKQALTKQSNRIIKRPIHKKGHLILDLCTQSGLTREIISRKQKDWYLKAKKFIWGDGY